MISLVKQLETAVIAAMKSVVGDAAKVTGVRMSVADGSVKLELSEGLPEVIVAVSPASSQSYASPVLEFPVAVSVRVEWSEDPTIAKFDEVAALIERKFMEWNLRENIEDMGAALTTENFRADGFTLAGGTDTVEPGNGRPTISTTMSFNVKGVFMAEAPTNQNT